MHSKHLSLADEEELLAALRAGEEQAFAALIERFGGRMRVTALRLLGQEDQADDAVQEAFLSAFRALDDFAEGSSLGTWLHRIVINAALGKRRADTRRREREWEVAGPSFAPGGAFTETQAAWHPPPDQDAMQRETRASVRACIERLPDNLRLALVLRDIEDLSNQQVAAHLDITPNACKLRVHRARQALRALLEPVFGGER